MSYKSQEEVLAVISHVLAICSTTGQHVTDTLENAAGGPMLNGIAGDAEVRRGQLRSPLAHLTVLRQTKKTGASVVYSGASIAICLLLKSHLQGLYGLSDEWVIDTCGVSSLMHLVFQPLHQISHYQQDWLGEGDSEA